MKLKYKILSKLRKLIHVFGFTKVQNSNEDIKNTLNEFYIETKLKFLKETDPLNISCNEYQVFSQNGEDGIIAEIFKRIGTTNKYFVEFGVGDGTENNTSNLLINDWSGSWIEGNEKNVEVIKQNLPSLLSSSRLKLLESFITTENINECFLNLEIPQEFDLLSIDIDGNDYWIWKALKSYKPRVVVIEYNASLGPTNNWIMPYNEKHIWNGKKIGHYFGASLKALEKFGDSVGYKLIGTNITGVNAFFVQSKLVDKNFKNNFSSEVHYNKPLYHISRQLGHKRNHSILNNL